MAKALAPKLNGLIVVARRAERLTELAQELHSRLPMLAVVVETADLSDPQAVESLLRRLDERGIDLDVLVSNAGLGEAELFEHSPWNRIQQIVAVNFASFPAAHGKSRTWRDPEHRVGRWLRRDG